MCIPKVILKNITLWGAYFRYTIIIKTEIADLLEHEVIVANINKLYWGTCAVEVVPFMSLRDKLTKHVCGEGYYEFL